MVINNYHITVYYVCNLSFHWIPFLLLHCFFVGSVKEYHWISLHTINIYFLHEEPMLVNVLYILSLCYEQSPHRLLMIETSAGCSCVQISLDLCPHDHHFFLLLVTVSLYKAEPTVALG